MLLWFSLQEFPFRAVDALLPLGRHHGLFGQLLVQIALLAHLFDVEADRRGQGAGVVPADFDRLTRFVVQPEGLDYEGGGQRALQGHRGVRTGAEALKNSNIFRNKYLYKPKN